MSEVAALSPFPAHLIRTGVGRSPLYPTELARSIVPARNGNLPAELGPGWNSYIRLLILKGHEYINRLSQEMLPYSRARFVKPFGPCNMRL